MKLIISDTTKTITFKSIFTLLCKIADEVEINVSKEKLFIQAMDTAHVCLYEVTLTKDWFNEYDVKKAGVYGVKMSLISKILSCLDDEMSICITNTNKDKLMFELSGKIISKKFELSLMDIDTERLSVPDVDHELEMTVNSNMFQGFVNQLSNFGDVVNICANENNFTMETKSEDQSETNMKIVLDTSDMEEYTVIEDEDVTSDFSLQHFQKIVSLGKLTSELKVYFSRELPIQIMFELSDESTVNLWLSPRIQDD